MPSTRGHMNTRLTAGAGVLAVALIATGCSSAGEGALSGGMFGAGAGAIVGSMFADAGKGALIGGAIGALGGGVMGDQNERQDRRARDRYYYDRYDR
jgi:osmotically inducible lipoprotein OsmB